MSHVRVEGFYAWIVLSGECEVLGSEHLLLEPVLVVEGFEVWTHFVRCDPLSGDLWLDRYGSDRLGLGDHLNQCIVVESELWSAQATIFRILLGLDGRFLFLSERQDAFCFRDLLESELLLHEPRFLFEGGQLLVNVLEVVRRRLADVHFLITESVRRGAWRPSIVLNFLSF